MRVTKGAPTDIEMIGNRILIKEFTGSEERSASGIITSLGDQVQWRGIVIAVGPGEYAADLAREAIASANKEIELTKKAIEIGNADGLVKSITAQAKAVAEAAEECRKSELESRGLVIPMQCKVGDIVMYQSGIWANSMKVNLDGHGEFLIIRENYVAMVRHKAGSPEAVRLAAEKGVEFE